jgi:hypothetical protein
MYLAEGILLGCGCVAHWSGRMYMGLTGNFYRCEMGAFQIFAYICAIRHYLFVENETTISHITP